MAASVAQPRPGALKRTGIGNPGTAGCLPVTKTRNPVPTGCLPGTSIGSSTFNVAHQQANWELGFRFSLPVNRIGRRRRAELLAGNENLGARALRAACRQPKSEHSMLGVVYGLPKSEAQVPRLLEHLRVWSPSKALCCWFPERGERSLRCMWSRNPTHGFVCESHAFHNPVRIGTVAPRNGSSAGER